jgi:hypothetical protein
MILWTTQLYFGVPYQTGIFWQLRDIHFIQDSAPWCQFRLLHHFPQFLYLCPSFSPSTYCLFLSLREHTAQLIVQSHVNSSCQSDGTLYYQCIYVPLAPPRTGEWSCILSVLSQPLDITDHNRNSQLRNQIFKAGTNYTSPSLVSLFRKRRYRWCNATFWTSSSSTRHYGSWGVRYFRERKAVHFICHKNRVNVAN